MSLALSMVSRTDSLPRISSSCLVLGVFGKASSRLSKLSNGPLAAFDCPFLASALFSAMTSFMLRGTLGVWGTTSEASTFDFTGVTARAPGCALALIGVPLEATFFMGVDGCFKDRVEDGWGIRDILKEHCSHGCSYNLNFNLR